MGIGGITMIDISLEEQEMVVLSVAITQYYESVHDEYRRIVSEISRIESIGSPILSMKLNFYKEDLSAKMRLMEAIGTLWNKIPVANSGEEEDNRSAE